jgi:hypothetical protein
VKATAKARTALVAGAVSYVSILHWAYVAVISPAYSYEGMVDNPASPGQMLTAAALAVAPTT